jgi:hypothetical protein
MVYIVCGLLSSAVLAAICVPLFRRDNSLESAIIEETQWDLLQRKKEVILGNIQDLDFEYKCGKLSEEDYTTIRSEMRGEAALVLQEIDSIESTQDLDALIRQEVLARKQTAKGLSSTKCPSCGLDNPAKNKFCAECGVKLKV